MGSVEAISTAADAPATWRREEQGRRILSNALALSFARPFTWFATIGLTILLPRYLGDVALGRWNVAFVFADWCGLFASFGVASYLTREVARRPAEASSTVLNALAFRAVLGVVVGGLAVLLATLMRFDSLTQTLVYLLTAHMILAVFNGVFIGALQGAQRLRVVASIDALTKLFQLGLVAMVLFSGHGVIAVAVVFIITDLVTLVAQLACVARFVGLSGRISLRTWNALIRGSAPFLVWEAALLTYARVDVVILSFFAPDAVIGWYGAAYRLISIPLFIPAVIMTAVFPALSASARDRQLFSTITGRALHGTFLLTVPMALGLMVVVGQIIKLFGYPEEFENTIIPTAVLAISLPFVGMNMILGSALAALDRQRAWAISGVIAAIVNPALNLLAIPYTQERFGNAGIGAATVTSATEIILVAAALILLPRNVLPAASLRRAAGCFLAGLAMALCLLPIRSEPVFYTIPLGALIYAAALFVFRGLTVGDITSLRSLIASRS